LPPVSAILERVSKSKLHSFLTSFHGNSKVRWRRFFEYHATKGLLSDFSVSAFFIFLTAVFEATFILLNLLELSTENAKAGRVVTLWLQTN
jgi:hypothetical protein